MPGLSLGEFLQEKMPCLCWLQWKNATNKRENGFLPSFHCENTTNIDVKICTVWTIWKSRDCPTMLNLGCMMKGRSREGEKRVPSSSPHSHVYWLPWHVMWPGGGVCGRDFLQVSWRAIINHWRPQEFLNFSTNSHIDSVTHEEFSISLPSCDKFVYLMHDKCAHLYFSACMCHRSPPQMN